MASEASQRQAGVTAHVKTPRFFFADTYDSRRPSYASTTSEYSQSTPKPVGGATFATRTFDDGTTRGEHPIRFRSEPVRAQYSELQAETPANRNVNGLIGKSSRPRPATFEMPRAAPRPRQQGPPVAYERHQHQQSRTRSLSNSFKEGIQRLGSRTRRRSSIDKDSIRPVRNSMRGDECGLGGRMTAEESAQFMLEAKVRQQKEQKVKARAEAQRQSQDELNPRSEALVPKHELRHVHGAASLTRLGKDGSSATVPRMRTLSGATDRMSILGPLVDAGPQNIKPSTLPTEADHSTARSAGGISVNQDNDCEQQQDQAGGLRRINGAVRWHSIKVKQSAKPVESATEPGDHKSDEPYGTMVGNGLNKIKRKPVSRPKEVLLPPCPKVDLSPLRTNKSTKRSTFAERVSAENIDDSGIGDMDFEDEDDGAAVLFPEQQATSAQRMRRGTSEDGSFSGDANDFEIDSTVIEAC
ncbi:hypothetical protein LTR56_009181 [Elasticomyces elasticus]|nr:hypothetical protein LTR56_009181 [Elasticomyces elasticus]KAK3664714.1 hypothetical protein LTR22_004301 [Elasticomyces elasticus]KAK4928524.1 hypothetical protein LTR49_004644 [Elasticomyces elasticus]KAK5741700.1 hypothetical protein LTS12_024517 [Elasticomyces elasticus]